LPEHTFAAKGLAYAQGADYLEQDVCLSKDGIPVVIHDIHLENTTDVASVFPGRTRADGRYYVIDFTIEELRRLSAHERVDSSGKPVFPDRFGLGGPRFEIHTLEEEIELIRRLNRETGREVGLYVEIKRPDFHQKEGRNISRVVLEVLARQGYTEKDAHCWIQCFDSATLRRLRAELHCRLRLTQLVAAKDTSDDSPDDFGAMLTPAGLAKVARYADAVGPALSRVILCGEDGKLRSTALINDAHAAGLEVCPYTLRRDDLPRGVTEDAVLELLFRKTGVDGLFTDFPGDAAEFLKKATVPSPTARD
jgi:glycerophosphoryl diester phosphodiesterase